MSKHILHETEQRQASDPLAAHRGYFARATQPALMRCAELVYAWEREALVTNDLDGVIFWSFIRSTIEDELEARGKRGKR